MSSQNLDSPTNGRPGNAAPANPTKQPLSPRRLAANQANAKKSTGPKTPEGKARARFNSLKHGLTATQVCLPGESRTEYDLRRQEYAEIFKPANIVEWDILDDLVAARWRKERAVRYEKCMLLDTFMHRRVDVEKDYEALSLDVEATLAFQALSDKSEFLKLLDRYETRIVNNILASWKLLHEAIQNRPPATGSPTESLPEAAPSLPSEPTANPEAVESEDPETQPGTPEPGGPEPIGHAYTPMTIVRRVPTVAQLTPAPAATSPLSLYAGSPCTSSM